MNTRGLTFLLSLLLPALAYAGSWFDQSHDVFLTRELKGAASNYRDYPLFWWNFLVLDGPVSDADAERLCAELARDWSNEIAKIPCHFDLKALADLTADWLADTSRRTPLNGESQIRDGMRDALAKASLPLPREALDLLRRDPLNALGELKDKVQSRVRFAKPLRGGMLVDEARARRLIPLQMTFGPADSSRSARLIDELARRCAKIAGCTRLALFGPHASTRENEARIREDIGAVSAVGSLGLLALAGFILLTRRHRLILLLPVLLAGLALATALTVWVFGSIHGITLAFGPGIAGLAMDYGVHAVFLDPRSRETWRSNLAGLLTTIVVLIVLLFSEIPLLRQLMFFSLVGLTLTFLLFFFLLRRWPNVFETRPYELSPRSWRFGRWLAMALFAASPLVLFRPIELSVQHLNYESEPTREIRRWFPTATGEQSPYWIAEDEKDPASSSKRALDWAEANGIAYEGIARYLPTPAEQAENLRGWRQVFCRGGVTLSETERRFFAPFLALQDCAALTPRDIRAEPPSYLADFRHGKRWVGLLFPQTESETVAVRARFPDAHTPREVFEAFPRVFLGELAWMVPFSLAAAFLLLWAHFRVFRHACFAVVPFLTGVGCFALAAWGLNLPVSFLSLIGLLMVFGFSLDYGIFVVHLALAGNEGKFGVWSALSVCSFSTLVGFVPLVFAGHPVLNDLGQALLWGSLGTYIGTYWGIPGLLRLGGSGVTGEVSR